jgi:hypothetical protein
MLLNYNGPSLFIAEGYDRTCVDENIKLIGVQLRKKGEWLQRILAQKCIHAVQINYADEQAGLMGKQSGKIHQYILYGSLDGKKWNILVDKRNNKSDVPHDYVELKQPVRARYVKMENIHVPTGTFALSGLRVFGIAKGNIPDSVKNFIVREIVNGEMPG